MTSQGTENLCWLECDMRGGKDKGHAGEAGKGVGQTRRCQLQPANQIWPEAQTCE